MSDDGTARVTDGLEEEVDVTIQCGHSQLIAALQSAGKSETSGGPPPKIGILTPKGRTAFNFLKGRFGL